VLEAVYYVQLVPNSRLTSNFDAKASGPMNLPLCIYVGMWICMDLGIFTAWLGGLTVVKTKCEASPVPLTVAVATSSM
jgi:hypothetical protein